MGGRWEGGKSNCFSHIDYWINKETADTWQTSVTNYYHKKKMILSQDCNNTLLAVSSLEMCFKWGASLCNGKTENTHQTPLLRNMCKHILVRCGRRDTANHKDRKSLSNGAINRHMSHPVF